MLGCRSRELSFSDAAEWPRRIPATSRWVQVRQWSLAHWPDSRFAAWYAADGQGRPSIPASYMSTLLLLHLMYGWSDRHAGDHAAFDDRWQFALGVSRTPEIVCDPATRCKFRAKALAQEAGRMLLRETLADASVAGLWGHEADITDRFMIAGTAARQGTVLHIARVTRQVLVEAEEASLPSPLLRRTDYRGRRQPAIDWASETARHAFLQALIADAATLTAWAPAPTPPESLRQAAALLETVAAQDITQDAHATVHIADQGAPDRILSAVDPAMRHGRTSSSQKFDGYKAHVSLQREDGGRPRLATGVTVMPGNAPDGNQTVAVFQEREALTGIRPQALWRDTAYGSVPTRQAVEEATPDVQWEAPVPPAVARDGQFPKTAFTIDCAAQTVTCPAGPPPPGRAGAESHRARARRPLRGLRAPCRLDSRDPWADCGHHGSRSGHPSGTGATSRPGVAASYRQRTTVKPGIRGLTRFRVGCSPGGDVCSA